MTCEYSTFQRVVQPAVVQRYFLQRFVFSAMVLIALSMLTSSGCSLIESTKNGFTNLLSPGSGGKYKDPTKDKFEFGETNPDRLVLSDLAPGEISTTFRAKLTKENRANAERLFQDAQAAYDQAISLWEQDPESAPAYKLFNESARLFRLAAASWKDSALEQDALFMIGEAQFFTDQYVLSNRAYEQLVARYPGTQHMDLVQHRRYTIARYWLESSRNKSGLGLGLNLTDDKRPLNDMAGHARRILHSIRLDDPTGRIADDATFALANAYFEAEMYEDAADTYEDLRRTYPGSEHQFKAHMLELKSRLTCYRGADYDGTQLVKADKIMKALATQFPDKLEENREYLNQEAKNIRTMLADRDYTIGKYFERRGENRAANLYYQSVAQSYGDTELASESLARADNLSGKPDVPNQKVAWFVNLFPEPRATKPLIAPGNGDTIMR